MEKILVSACLLGENTKYNGKNNYLKDITRVKEKYTIVPFCPEVEGGLSTPRDPSEQIGDDVFMKTSKGLKRVTKHFSLGASKALNICQYLGIKKVLLKERSPSCGSKEVYDGTFKEKTKKGSGVT